MTIKREKPDSVIAFLRETYSKDLLISDRSVLAMILDKFPNSKATNSTLYTWKVQLRKMGIKIPLHRQSNRS